MNMMRSVSLAVSGAASDFTFLYITLLIMVTLQLFPKDVNTVPECLAAPMPYTSKPLNELFPVSILFAAFRLCRFSSFSLQSPQGS